MPKKPESEQKRRPSVGSVRPSGPKEQHVAVRRGATGIQSKDEQQGPHTQHAAVTPLPARSSAPVARESRFAQDLSRVPAVQRDNGDEAGGAAAEAVEVPSVAGASQLGFVGDILTVLDTTLTLADIIGGAAGVAALETVGFMAVAGSVGLAGAIGFLIVGLFMWADAWLAGEKLAAVQAGAYALVSIAHGREPPSAPSWMGEAARFNSTGQNVKTTLQRKIDAGGAEKDQALGSLVAIRRAEPETILNQIYQRLVRQHLQATFLGIQMGGGLYSQARRFYLGWPGVNIERQQD